MKKAILTFLLIIFVTPIYAGDCSLREDRSNTKVTILDTSCGDIYSNQTVEIEDWQTKERYFFKVEDSNDLFGLTGRNRKDGKRRTFGWD
jgi:hypothetical protein|tara:strand:- start:208 stop:477 length:270 start_codon:yes stop_codon:yes gene_type:complete